VRWTKPGEMLTMVRGRVDTWTRGAYLQQSVSIRTYGHVCDAYRHWAREQCIRGPVELAQRLEPAEAALIVGKLEPTFLCCRVDLLHHGETARNQRLRALIPTGSVPEELAGD
jgi:hypothetical protein